MRLTETPSPPDHASFTGWPAVTTGPGRPVNAIGRVEATGAEEVVDCARAAAMKEAPTRKACEKYMVVEKRRPGVLKKEEIKLRYR